MPAMDPNEKLAYIKDLIDVTQLPPGVEANPTELPGGISSIIRAVMTADTESAAQDVRSKIAQLNDERMRSLGQGKLANERFSVQERTEQVLAREKALNDRLAMELSAKEKLAQMGMSQAADKQTAALLMAKQASDAKINEMLAEKNWRMNTVQDLLKQAKYAITDGGAVRMGPHLQTIADQIRSVEGGDSFAARGIEQQVAQNRTRMVNEIIGELLPAMKDSGLPVTEPALKAFRDQIDTMIASGTDRATARDAAQRQAQADIGAAKQAAAAETEALAKTRELVKKGLPVAEAHRMATDASMHPEIKAMAAEEAVGKVAKGKLLKGGLAGAGMAVLAAALGSKLFGKTEAESADPAAQQMQMLALVSALKGKGGDETQQAGRELGNLSKTLGIVKLLQTMGGFGAAAQATPSLASMV